MAGGMDHFNVEGGNKRGRPELGIVDPSGIVAYPVTNRKNEESSVNRFKNLRDVERGSDYDRSRQKRNISGFRNVSQSPFLSPGFDRTTGQMKNDRAIISIEGTPAGRGSDGKLFDNQTIGVSNVIPMNDPRFIIQTPAQKKAFEENRQRLAFGAGRSSPEEIGGLFSGVLEGLGSEFQLVRNKFGDAELVDMQGKELPSIAFDIYDLIDHTISNSKKRWAKNNRRFRTDTGQVWRDTYPKRVTGSVDPVLRLPNEFFMEELGDTFQDRWINHTDREGHTYRGVPIPSNFAPNKGELGLDRAILTTRGFHFLPEWANNRFQPILDAAMVGDVIRSEEDCFNDAWDVMKIDMERLQQAQNIEQIEGDENMVNVELAPQDTAGSCCDAFKQRVEGIFGGGTPYEIGNGAEWMIPIIHQKYGYDLSFDPSDPDFDLDWYDVLDCEQIIDFFNGHMEDHLRDVYYDGESGPWTHMRNEMLDAIQEYESCERGEGGGTPSPFVSTGDDDVSVAYF